MFYIEPLLKNLDGVPSWKYDKSPPPFEFLSILHVVQSPFIRNWAEGNKSSSLVSEISDMHCVKSVRIRSYSSPYFPAFGLNTDQNNSKYGHFLRSDVYISINNER